MVHDALFSTEPDWYTRPLPNLFVTHAERCLYRFNDPLGEKVDLYAQYLVIREYWRRDNKGEQTKDLDFMLDNTTWLYDDENLENTTYYKTIEKEPKRKPQYLTESDIVKLLNLESLSGRMKRIIQFYISTGLRCSSVFYGHIKSKPLGNYLVIPADAPYNKAKKRIEISINNQ